MGQKISINMFNITCNSSSPPRSIHSNYIIAHNIHFTLPNDCISVVTVASSGTFLAKKYFFILHIFLFLYSFSIFFWSIGLLLHFCFCVLFVKRLWRKRLVERSEFGLAYRGKMSLEKGLLNKCARNIEWLCQKEGLNFGKIQAYITLA